MQKRRVAFVGDSRTRMQEDYLRILRYFRFCARISPDPNLHEPDTEQALLENMEGLSRISGERIWLELKQILSNRHAGPLLETMLRLGIAPHIGLGNNPSLKEFKVIWERAKNNDIKLLPITLLAALLDSEEAVINILHFFIIYLLRSLNDRNLFFSGSFSS